MKFRSKAVVSLVIFFVFLFWGSYKNNLYNNFREEAKKIVESYEDEYNVEEIEKRTDFLIKRLMSKEGYDEDSLRSWPYYLVAFISMIYFIYSIKRVNE